MKHIALVDQPRLRHWRIRWIQLRAKVDRLPIDVAVVAGSLGLLLAFPLGIITGMGFERRQAEIVARDLAMRVEIAAYRACAIRFLEGVRNSKEKFVAPSEASYYERGRKCAEIGTAARAVVEGKKTK